MATRYWVGGAGTWDATTTHWSTTSGGAAGASAPTSADDVIIDTSSGTGTIAPSSTNGVAVCRNLTVTASQAITISASNQYINIYGSLSFPSGGSFTTGSGRYYFASTTTGNTINTNGKTLGGGRADSIAFTGVGGGWTLQSALTGGSSAGITFNAGSLDTANFNVSADTFTSTGSTTRSLTLGTSTVSLANNGIGTVIWNTSGATNFTLSAASSTISITAPNSTQFAGNGYTYGNLTIGSLASSLAVQFNDSNTFSGTISNSSTGSPAIWLTAGITLTVGTWAVTGSSMSNIVTLNTTTGGSQATISQASGTVNSNYMYISDIAVTGGATWNAGARSSDQGNNTGWNFPTTNVYWVGGTGTWNATSSARWSSASGGTASTSLAPGRNNPVIFNGNSGTGTVTLNSVSGTLLSASIDTTGSSLTFSGNGTQNAVGSFTLSSTTVWSGTGTITFSGTGTITTNGVSLSCPVVVNATGTITLGGALTHALAFTFTQGTINLNGFNWSSATFSSNNSNTRALQFGAGSINVTGSGASLWTLGAATGFTYTGTPTVNISNNSATASTILMQSATAANALNFNFTTGTYAITISGTGTFGNLNFTGFTGTLAGASPCSVFGSLTLVSGMTYTSTGAVTFGATSTGKTITVAGKTLGATTFNGAGGDWTLQDAFVSSGAITLTNGALNTNNQTISSTTFVYSGTGTASLTLGTSVLTLSGTGTAWSFATATGLTFSGASASIILSDNSTTAKTFAGGGYTYGSLQIGATGGSTAIATYTFTGANTFNAFSSTKSVASTITLPASTTTTFKLFTVSGSLGNLITLQSSTSGTRATLNYTGLGVVSVDYLAIKDNNATSVLTWYAGAHSTNTSNNLGWVFTAPPSPGGGTSNYFLLF